jgi:hypothetical protein
MRGDIMPGGEEPRASGDVVISEAYEVGFVQR